jgi:hypothetical protein
MMGVESRDVSPMYWSWMAQVHCLRRYYDGSLD